MEEPTKAVAPTPKDGSGMVLSKLGSYHLRESRSCLMEVAKTVRLRQLSHGEMMDLKPFLDI